jgi:PAS domain S-box-containing protein
LVDLSGKVLEVNKSVKAIFGYSPEEVLGRSVMELNLFDADELATMTKLLADSIAHQEPVQPLTGMRRDTRMAMRFMWK